MTQYKNNVIQEGNKYHIIFSQFIQLNSLLIQMNQKYIILILNYLYLSLYSNTKYDTVINVKIEEKKDLQNIEQRTKLYFRVFAKDYSGKKVDIELNFPK